MQMVTKIENSTMGIKYLINFLLTIYKIDYLQDCYDYYVEYQDITRKSGKSMVDLLNRWDMAVAKIKKYDCTLLDKVLALPC